MSITQEQADEIVSLAQRYDLDALQAYVASLVSNESNDDDAGVCYGYVTCSGPRPGV